MRNGRARRLADERREARSRYRKARTKAGRKEGWIPRGAAEKEHNGDGMDGDAARC